MLQLSYGHLSVVYSGLWVKLYLWSSEANHLKPSAGGHVQRAVTQDDARRSRR
jgi:hypothetical protein